MKTKEELNAIKEDELEPITGGGDSFPGLPPCQVKWVKKPPAGTCEEAIDCSECEKCPSNSKNKLYSPIDNPSADHSLRGQ